MRRRWQVYRHLALMIVCVLMLIPFYWMAKIALTDANIHTAPARLLDIVDGRQLSPFRRSLLNSVIVSAIAVAGNLLLNVMAAYALTQRFPGRRLVVLLLLACLLIPFQATIIPAYLVTARLGLLNTYFGFALPTLSTIICIFIFKSAFESVPRSLIDAARMDGLGVWRIVTRVLLPLSRPALATNIALTFIWSWNGFMWPLLATRDATMQTLPLGLARFYMQDTTGALYAIVVMALAPSLFVFLVAQTLLHAAPLGRFSVASPYRPLLTVRAAAGAGDRIDVA